MMVNSASNQVCVWIIAVVMTFLVVAGCSTRPAGDTPSSGGSEAIVDSSAAEATVGSGDETPPVSSSSVTLWWSRSQGSNGSWSSRANGGDEGMDEADTALMTLAFLSAGVHEKTRQLNRGDRVRRAVAYLRSRQSPDGSTGRDLWTRSLVTLAFTEAYGIARVPETGQAAQKAIDALARQITSDPEEMRQRLVGGKWPEGPPALAFVAAALKSGTIAGLRVPPAAVDQVSLLLTDLDREARTPLDAAAALAVRFLVPGPNRARIRDMPEAHRHAETLAANLPRWEEGKMDFRYFFLGSVGMFAMRGDYWKRWYSVMRPILIDRLILEGEYDGSWPQADVNSSGTTNVSPRASRTNVYALGSMSGTVHCKSLNILKD